MVDFTKINNAENNIEHWREEAMSWWKNCYKACRMVKKLRKENRILRLLVADYQLDLDELKLTIEELENKS